MSKNFRRKRVLWRILIKVGKPTYGLKCRSIKSSTIRLHWFKEKFRNLKTIIFMSAYTCKDIWNSDLRALAWVARSMVGNIETKVQVNNRPLLPDSRSGHRFMCTSNLFGCSTGRSTATKTKKLADTFEESFTRDRALRNWYLNA